jgi:fatty acid desaturase
MESDPVLSTDTPVEAPHASRRRGALVLRVLRVWVATTLMASGGLLYAASWQRWAGACPWRGNQ